MISRLCQRKEFFTRDFNFWCEKIKETPRLHRKQWEFYAICQALEEMDMLQTEKSGCGFGVGNEPLPSLFASRGCQILATDLPEEDERAIAWSKTNQHAKIERLNERKICPPDKFKDLVDYQSVDMNFLPDDLNNKFDFVWSACCFEHCGSISNGLNFVLNSLNLLKKGGVAVHTTELNLSSKTDTVLFGPTVLFRQCDIRKLRHVAKKKGFEVGKINWNMGDTPDDNYIDSPPYCQDRHLKLQIGNFVSTSIIIIIRRPNE